MRWGIITLTIGGMELAVRIKEHFSEAVLHLPEKFKRPDCELIQGTFSDYVGAILGRYDVLVFIMASGIVVRSIAPYLKSKTEDPAVLVLDEKGKFVISLVSGHIGGANKAAVELASAIGAQPVITTSSDVNDLVAVDTLAEALDCAIDDMNRAKEISALLVNRKNVAVVSDFAFDLPEGFTNDPDAADGIIFVTNKNIINPGKPYVRLVPRNIVIGIGCRKGTESPDIINMIIRMLDKTGINKQSIKCFASIDIKEREQGMLDAVEYFKKQIRFFSKEDIKLVENLFASSEFVRSKTGVGAVAEPCAFLASDRSGRMILNKAKESGITVAIWEEER